MSLHQVDWGDGSPISSVPAGGTIPDHVYNIVGTRTLIARVTEADGTTEAARTSAPITIPAGVVQSISPNVGPPDGGTACTIAGEGLTGTTGVFFGAAQATGVQVIHDGLVACTSPAGPAATPVNVACMTRGTGTNQAQFNYGAADEEEAEASAAVPTKKAARGPRRAR